MYTLCFHLYIYLFYRQNVSILNKSKNSITHNFQPETNQDISLIHCGERRDVESGDWVEMRTLTEAFT